MTACLSFARKVHLLHKCQQLSLIIRFDNLAKLQISRRSILSSIYYRHSLQIILIETPFSEGIQQNNMPHHFKLHNNI